MSKYHVIKHSSLPARSPLLLTIVMWLLLDRLQSVQWAWGAVGVILVLIWIGFIIRVFTDSQADLAGFGERKK